MVVHDRSYARWDGDREAAVPGARTIFERGVTTTVARLFKRKLFAQGLSFLVYGPFLFAAGVLYLVFFFEANQESFGRAAEGLADSGLLAYVTPTPDTVWGYLLQVQILQVVIMCVLVGAGLVAEDRRTNALELYLSRPLSVFQYVLGKFSVVAFFLALATIVPACLLILERMFLTGFEAGQLRALVPLMGRTVAAGGVLIAFLSLLVLAASSLATRARTAAVLWIGTLIIVDGVVANILNDVFSDRFQLVSLYFNLGQVVAWVLDNAAEIDVRVPVWQSALVLGGWAALCLGVIRRRVQPVEIVA